MDSSRFQGGSLEKRRLLVTLGHESAEKTSCDNQFSESSRRRSNLLPTIQTSIFQEQTKFATAAVGGGLGTLDGGRWRDVQRHLGLLLEN